MSNFFQSHSSRRSFKNQAKKKGGVLIPKISFYMFAQSVRGKMDMQSS